MPRVLHLVVTGNFAGVERYVCEVARETAARGWEVTIVGGDRGCMPEAVGRDVRWLPGATPAGALRSLCRLGRQHVCHAHMTVAEAVALAARPIHRAPVVATRHFAACRGSSVAGRLLAPWISARLSREIAVSDFVAKHLEMPPHSVLRNGVPSLPAVWRRENRVVLVMQRLEPEKDTMTSLRAWQLSGLAEDGWSLRIIGSGSTRNALERWTAENGVGGVVFAGWTSNVLHEFSRAGVLLAPAPAEPFGLAVIEAMAAGVPVAACSGGGHLETVGLLEEAPMFPPGDAETAAAALRSMLPDARRASLSNAGRRLVSEEFGIAAHVDALLDQYQAALRREPRLPGLLRHA